MLFSITVSQLLYAFCLITLCEACNSTVSTFIILNILMVYSLCSYLYIYLYLFVHNICIKTENTGRRRHRHSSPDRRQTFLNIFSIFLCIYIRIEFTFDDAVSHDNHRHDNQKNKMHSESGVEKRPPSSSPFKYVSLATTCTLIVAFGSVLYQAYLESQNLSHITAIASGLVRLEHDDAVQVLPRRLQRRGGSTIDGSAPDEVPLLPPRVAIGYGSCSDVYVDVSWFLNYTADSGGHRTDDDDAAADVPNEIHNERDLLQSFGYYFARGAAAE